MLETRANALNGLYLNAQGIIASPGRYEGEPAYTPAAEAIVNAGFAETVWCDCAEECSCVPTYLLTLDDEDRAEWPELTGIDSLLFYTDDNGFAYCRARH